jgi:hypothetical protein
MKSLVQGGLALSRGFLPTINGRQWGARSRAGRRLRPVLAGLAALVASLHLDGCEDATFEESRAACERSCGRQSDCAAQEASMGNCVEACVNDVEEYASKGCRDGLRGFLQCTATLSCADLATWTADVVPAPCAPQFDAARTACSVVASGGGGD